MKYKDILQFEPITDVIQVDLLREQDYRKNIISTFVYPDYFMNTVLPTMVDNIDFSKSGRKGLQIIGNYGTGKSHLMSLVSLVAEDADLLQDVRKKEAKQILEPIAGKFKVLRFEIGNFNPLWNIITFELQRYLKSLGVDFAFEKDSLKQYREQLEEMMSAFEEKYPGQGLMLVVDEMLSFLKGRAAEGKLDQDLPVLQALGQICAKSHFAFMYGVQEMIYQAREFMMLADMLLKVKDRYQDLTIRKEDVAFIVHDRLLRKSEQQKQAVRNHLEPFRKFFSDMNGHFENYVELFPVHPSYFDNFQQVKLGQAQREVLKTLSAQFADIAENDIPTNEPGLITYDTYWEHLMKSTGYNSIPDYMTVKDTVQLVHSKIDTNFTEARAKQRPLAKRIVNASAIKILQDSLSKRNGASAESLVDELCITSTLPDADKELLVDMVASCGRLVVNATSGQYFDCNEDNGEFHLRTEGGINVDQIIKQVADNASDAQKDAYYFEFLVEALGIDIDPCRTGFRIYRHELPWASHKVARDGYIFFGNSGEKSTTHPKQFFYMMFMPIFQNAVRSNEKDEIYFDMRGLSDDFKEKVCLHGAAKSMIGSSDSSQKGLYQGKKDELFRKARHAFDDCYLKATKVVYNNNEKILHSYTLPANVTKLEIFDSVAAEVFEENFTAQTPHYPKFTLANQTITKDNLQRYIKGVFLKLQKPSDTNQDGQAILNGLGLYSAGVIDATDSIYAQSILKMMSERDENKVVNRDEILEVLAHSNDLIWRTKDYQLEAALEFAVLATLAHLGECEVVLNSGDTLNSSTMHLLNTLQPSDYYNFSSIKRPKGLNLPVIKAITLGLCGKDLSNQLDSDSTYVSIVKCAQDGATKAATLSATRLNSAITISGVEILSSADAYELKKKVDMFKGFCDNMQKFTSLPKLKNLPYNLEKVKERIDAKHEMEAFEQKLNTARALEAEVSYLTQALQYVNPASALYSQLSGAIQKLIEVLKNPTEQAVKLYQEELVSAKEAYIDYYLKLYNSYCLSDIDEQKRIVIMNSAEYVVVEKLVDCPMLNPTQWTTWRSQFVQLRSANPNAKQMLQTTPFVSPFNPLVSSKELPSVLEMETQLKDIYDSYIEQLKEFVRSKEVQNSLKLMDDGARNYAQGFENGLRVIQTAFDAQTLVEFINTVGDGFYRAEITLDGLNKYLNRPMTIDEAIGAFTNYMTRIQNGQAKSKVRVILNLTNNQ